MSHSIPPFEIARWIAGYLSKSLDPEEQAKLDHWRQASPAHEALFQKLCNEQRLLRYTEQRSWFDEAKGWQQLQGRIHKQQRRQRLLHQIANVAAALLLPLLWSALSPQLHSPTPIPVAHPPVVHSSITPGSAQALLTLEDGRTLPLNSSTDTLLTQASSTTIRLDSAQLTYKHTAHATQVQLPTAWNSIQTPKGGEYRLTLSDGTRVYLNAMSTLRFPVAFDEDTRTVELSGEAYFEVSHSGHPFVVKTQLMEVEVMGTAFNLSAYPDEMSHTTLVTGSVKVSAPKAGTRLLLPSQQASLSPNGGTLKIKRVDTDCFTAWTQGKILFKDERLDEMMKQLSRWYDMEVRFTDPSLEALRFGCHLNRYADITPFVGLLEQTGKVSVKIEGHQILIAPPTTPPKRLSK